MKQETFTDMEYNCRNAPSSTKNAEKARDPELHQTKKGNEWQFGMKCHIGVDAGSGLIHTITVTAANAQFKNDFLAHWGATEQVHTLIKLVDSW